MDILSNIQGMSEFLEPTMFFSTDEKYERTQEFRSDKLYKFNTQNSWQTDWPYSFVV